MPNPPIAFDGLAEALQNAPHFSHEPDCWPPESEYERLEERLIEAEAALWRVQPNTFTLEMPGFSTPPDPFEGEGETYAQAYSRIKDQFSELVGLYRDYARLLGEEIEAFVPLIAAHGLLERRPDGNMETPRYARGKELRDAINAKITELQLPS